MGEWIPLLQSLVWPLFIAIFLLLVRRHVVAILKSISSRIESGDPFQAGPTGIALGQSERKLTRLEEAAEPAPAPGRGLDVQQARGPADEAEASPAQLRTVAYLVHTVTAARKDTDGVERRAISVIVDADSEQILDKIDRVVYHLHPTFPNPEVTTTDRQRQFVLNTSAWGEFNLSADVYFKGFDQPLTLFRYLNFH